MLGAFVPAARHSVVVPEADRPVSARESHAAALAEAKEDGLPRYARNDGGRARYILAKVFCFFFPKKKACPSFP